MLAFLTGGVVENPQESDEDDFAKLMTRKARALGMSNRFRTER